MLEINLPTTKDPHAKEHVIEYEPEIVTTHGTYKQSHLPTGKPKADKKEIPTIPRCPFLCRPCNKGCAFYEGENCNILTGGRVISCGICPFSGTNTKFCGDGCMMYNNGSCKLFSGKAGA